MQQSEGCPMNISDFLSRLKNVSKASGGWIACCPAHDDHSPSLSISEGSDGRILIKCHAGCTTEQVVATMSLSMSDLFPVSTDAFNFPAIAGRSARTAQYRSKKPMRETSFHPYTKDGELRAGVFRFDPVDGSNGKQYVPVHATSGGGALGDPAEGWPLYRLEIIRQRPDEPVFLVEGEKAADALAELGLLVTTSAHGSNAWKKTDWSPLVGRDLIAMPDNDDAGRKYIEDVIAHLHELGGLNSLRRIELNHLAAKADAYDLIAVLREETVSDEEIKTHLHSMTEDWKPVQSSAEEPVLNAVEKTETEPPEFALIRKLTTHYGDPFNRNAKGNPHRLPVAQTFLSAIPNPHGLPTSVLCLPTSVDSPGYTGTSPHFSILPNSSTTSTHGCAAGINPPSKIACSSVKRLSLPGRPILEKHFSPL
jgi:hypothetical protein